MLPPPEDTAPGSVLEAGLGLASCCLPRTVRLQECGRTLLSLQLSQCLPRCLVIAGQQLELPITGQLSLTTGSSDLGVPVDLECLQTLLESVSPLRFFKGQLSSLPLAL